MSKQLIFLCRSNDNSAIATVYAVWWFSASWGICCSFSCSEWNWLGLINVSVSGAWLMTLSMPNVVPLCAVTTKCLWPGEKTPTLASSLPPLALSLSSFSHGFFIFFYKYPFWLCLVSSMQSLQCSHLVYLIQNVLLCGRETHKPLSY